MMKRKGKIEWPEHTTLWDRNELKINIILWVGFFVLLLAAKVIFIDREVTLIGSAIWFILFVTDLFLLSFIGSSAR